MSRIIYNLILLKFVIQEIMLCNSCYSVAFHRPFVILMVWSLLYGDMTVLWGFLIFWVCRISRIHVAFESQIPWIGVNHSQLDVALFYSEILHRTSPSSPLYLFAHSLNWQSHRFLPMKKYRLKIGERSDIYLTVEVDLQLMKATVLIESSCFLSVLSDFLCSSAIFFVISLVQAFT